MKYEILLFDIDNTLLDFDCNEFESFKNTMLDKVIEYTLELYNNYKEINHEMWKAVEREELTINDVINTRFSRLMNLYNKTVDGQDFEKTYRSYLNKGIQKMPYVDETLAELNKKYKLYIITNGVAKTQTHRMKNSGLDKYFEKSFISEEIGSNKPSKLFFNFVKTNIDNFDSSKALVIGDSLTSDIKGGNDAKIDTCWICKEGTINNSDIKPKYIIHSLKDLFNILEI